MEPISMILAAVATGVQFAAKDTVAKAVKDGYEGLKELIKKKFGSESDLVDAVNKFEKKPDSEGRKSMLQEELEIAKVNEDPEILQLAQDLLDKIKEQPGGQQVINQTQTNRVTDIGSIGGNFEFKPVQEGNKS